MDTRALLTEIPGGKFHSAIFTTFSINLYYLEQQVLPLMHNKGIGYVSILADANILSGILDNYGIMSENRKRSYSLHGVHSDGAFHPKIIFLAGENHILFLLGSGNLTTAGHGRNLESWSVVYIDNEHHRDAPLVASIWQYLSRLHERLGDSAIEKLKTIKQNCRLLKEGLIPKQKVSWEKSPAIAIFDDKRSSILQKLKDLVPSGSVKTLTVFSPFYDTRGKLISLLDRHFKPDRINIILQEKFGCFPKHMVVADHMYFYSWKDWNAKNNKVRYSHAKKLLFETAEGNFLLTGSANASIAAMGDEHFSGHNQEACLLYRIGKFNLLEKLHINPTDTVDMHALEEAPTASASQEEKVPRYSIFITFLEYAQGELNAHFSSEEAAIEMTLNLYNTRGNVLFEKGITITKGPNNIKIAVPPEPYFYGAIIKNNQKYSNSQFIIDMNRFDATNPSIENRDFLKVKYMVEAGNFADGKILDYLATITRRDDQQTEEKIAHATSAETEQKDSSGGAKKIELSYDQIRERASDDRTILQRELKSSRAGELWETILGYLRDGFQRSLQEKINEEEMEDINSSTGRKVHADIKPAALRLSISALDSIRKKMSKHLGLYMDTLYNHTNRKSPEPPALIDLSIFLIVLQMLLHFRHKKFIAGELEVEEYLFPLPYSSTELSWSAYLISIIGVFNLWASRSILSETPGEQSDKFTLYRAHAHQLVVAAMATYGEVNLKVDVERTRRHQHLAILNAKRNLYKQGEPAPSIEDILSMLPVELIQGGAAEHIRDEISICKNIYLVSNAEDRYFDHMTDGWCYILKAIKLRVSGENVVYKYANIGHHYSTAKEEYVSKQLIDPVTYRTYSYRS